MKKIVPFKKEIIFKSNLSEITSISLEHSLHYEANNLITGEFIISGDYRMNDESINTEEFNFNIPFDINMDEKYVLDKVVIDINDFYYEIINSKVLLVNIEVAIDKLEEKPLIIEEEKLEEITSDIPKLELEEDKELVREDLEETASELVENLKVQELETMTSNKIDDIKEMKEKKEMEKERCVEEEEKEQVEVKSLFDNITGEEEYASYKICIVREGDSLESIMMKYDISKEQMELYNDLRKIKIGDKLIIPSVKS